MKLSDYEYYREPSGVIYCGDCLEILPLLEPGSVDLVVTDPPYGYNKGYANDEVFSRDFHESYWQLIKSYNLSQAILFWGYRNTITGLIDITGSPHQIITWCKPNAPMRKNVKAYHFSTEHIFWYVFNDDFIFNRPEGEAGRDYWRIEVMNGFLREGDWFHPSSKPQKLLKRIIVSHSNDCQTILDPFLGSGTTAVAAKQLGRKFIGIEIKEKYCEIAKQRLAQEELALAS